MRRLVAVTLIALLALTGAAAQQSLNLQIRQIDHHFEGSQLVVTFTLINSGAAMTSAETARLFNGDGAMLVEQPVKPLGANQSLANIEMAVPLDYFPLDAAQTLCAVVGLQQLPPSNLRNQFSNVGCLSVTVTATDLPTPTPGVLPGGLDSININDRATQAVILGVGVVLVVLLWLVTVIFRMIFSRPPTLSAWHPYVITPLVDPNSTNGRRQLWQQHAQSDTLPVPCAQGNYMVRKVLIGSSGVKLNGWRVTGLRVSQYDRYGRVARTQTVLPKKTVKALNRVARKSPSLDWERAVRAVRPVARALSNAVAKKMNPQNAVLPIALDIRFVGLHGEVRILFELYGCDGSVWQEIDHWEPEMRVVNGSIEENFTYSVAGQYAQEPRKQFRQRLETDLTNLLAGMVQQPPPLPPPEDTTENQAVG
ncbi:MAG: hypothetical protein U0521_20515 [Anaerolineae bacterium]